MAVLKTSLHGRLAPTPSGLLHAGNGVSFIITWLLVRASGGTLLLRIDDLDRQRMRSEYLEDIFRSIEWLGLDYDRGPSGPTDFLQNWSQEQRLPLYEEVLTQLRQQQHIYGCRCSRRQIREKHPDGRYSGTCREQQHALDRAQTAWRIRLPSNARGVFTDQLLGPQEIDLVATLFDFVVRQKNGRPAYQIASLVDDRHYGINAVVRGLDLLGSTAAQHYLATQLGWTNFKNAYFFHHRLRKDSDGEKLSKSTGAPAIRSWRASQRAPITLWRQAAEWLDLPVNPRENLPALQSELLEKTKGRYST